MENLVMMFLGVLLVVFFSLLLLVGSLFFLSLLVGSVFAMFNKPQPKWVDRFKGWI